MTSLRLSLRRRRLGRRGRATSNLLGGKGANLAEMASIGLPVPPGFTISTEICARYYAEGRGLPRRAARRGRRRHRPYRAGDRQALRRRRRSAAGLGPLRRARVDAGDDGHGPQSRPQRRDGRGPRRHVGRSRASPGTAIAASSRCTPTSCSASTTTCSRKRSRSPRRTRASISTPSSTPADWERLDRALQGAGRGGAGPRLSRTIRTSSSGARSAPCSAPGRPIARKTYRRLNDIPDDWGTAVNVQAMVFGNMGETSATGVAFTRDPSTGERAYYGEYLINAQGEDVVAGIRTPQYLTRAAREKAGAQGAVDGRGDARGLRRARRRLRPARAPLSRHAGHRVHRRARHAVDAPDPHRQAHRQGGAADRGRHGARRADHRGGGGAARRSRGARSTAPSDARSRRAARRDRQGPARLAGRRLRQGGVRRRHRRSAGPAAARRSSWSGSRPAPRTFTACTPPRASSPRAAA